MVKGPVQIIQSVGDGDGKVLDLYIPVSRQIF